MIIRPVKKFMYRVRENDNINTICTRFNTSRANILRNNEDIDLYAGEMIEIEVNDYLTHIVKPTETVNVISEKYGVSVNKLIHDNNLESTRLYIGQPIKIYKDKN